MKQFIYLLSAILIVEFSVPMAWCEGIGPTITELKSQTPELIDTTQDFAALRASMDRLLILEKDPVQRTLASTVSLRKELEAQLKGLTDAKTMYGEPGQLKVPPHSRVKVRLFYYFIEGTLGGAHPGKEAYYAWHEEKDFDIPYYSALMKVASTFQPNDFRIYDLLFRIYSNEGFSGFKNQPEEQKILLAIDPNAATNLVTRDNPPASRLLRDLPRPVASPDAAQIIEGVSLYADTRTFERPQYMVATFYNAGDSPVLVDVTTFLLRSDGKADIDLAVTLQPGPGPQTLKIQQYLQDKLRHP